MKIDTIVTLLVSGAAVIAFMDWFNRQRAAQPVTGMNVEKPASGAGWWKSGSPDKTASSDCKCIAAPCDCEGAAHAQWAEYGVLTPYNL